MRKVFKLVDSISNWAGIIASWAGLALVLTIVYEVIARYIFNAPTIWGYEVGIFLGMCLYCFGYTYTEYKHGHVRVDVFYTKWSPRGQAIADTISSIFFFIPTIGLVLFFAFKKMWWSWIVMEKSVEGYWYPPWYPTRTLIFLGFAFLFMQGLVNLSRALYRVIKGKEYA